MILTKSENSYSDRFTKVLVWAWGLIYLFFSTIFTAHKKLGHTSINGNRGGSNMKGLGDKKQGPKIGGG